MLNFIKSFIVFLILGFAFSACQKDDDIEPGNNFLFNGKSFELSQAFLVDHGQVGQGLGYWMELFLLSPGIKVHEAGGSIDSTSGKGEFLYFEIFSTVGGALGEGEYVFDPNETYKSKTFDYSIAIFNSNPSKRPEESSQITAGKVTIVKQGTDYSLTFDCAVADGTRITGTYKGPLKYYSRL